MFEAKADEESAVLAMIAVKPGPDRAIRKRFHAIIKARAPALSARLWYGMPAYVKDAKAVGSFQSSQKFNTMYAMFASVLNELTATEEGRNSAVVKKGVVSYGSFPS